MRKILAAAILLLLASSAAGVDFETILLDDDRDEIFQMDGFIFSSSENTTEVIIEYNLTLEVNYNKTSLKNFTTTLAHGNRTVAADSSKPGNLKPGESLSGFKTIESRTPPDLVDRVKILLEYQKTVSDGSKVKENASNYFLYDLNDRNPRIKTLETSSPEVRRGQNITVTAETADISRLKTAETNFSKTGNDTFRANLTVPQETSEGEPPVYTIIDGRGNVFQKYLDARVINEPPELELEFDWNVTQGENTEITIMDSDDYRVNKTYIEFRGRRYRKGDSKKITILTEALDPGTYRFKAVTVDNEGARTTRTGGLSIPGEGTPAKKPGTGSQETQNRGDEENPGSLTFVESIIKFLKSLF